jgi:diguanylate cyclase (GGDEF)-like protein
VGDAVAPAAAPRAGQRAARRVAAAGGLLLVPGATGGFDPIVAVALLGVYVILACVEFPVGAGNVVPTQLVLVPMLVLLPPATVPPLVAAGLLLAKSSNWLRGRASADHLLFAIPDAWHAVGPAALLLIAGAPQLDLGDLPLMIAAFACCCLFDVVSAVLREAAARGVAPTLQLRVFALVWLVDACLAPIGFIAATAAEDNTVAILLVLPLAALLALLGRDRRKRIDQAQHRLEVAIRERGRLQSAVRRMGDAFAAKLDLDALLETVLHGSIEALDADAGCLHIGDRGRSTGLDELGPVLRSASDAAAEGGLPQQIPHDSGWAVALPLTVEGAPSAPGTVAIARRERAFETDELELLGELVAKAQTAAAEILAHQALREEAAHDPLTGLGNRRKLNFDSGDWVGRVDAAPRLLMLLDLNGFKGYNDTFGHVAGDALLARLGANLSAAVAPYGTAYRLGGDEFCTVVRADIDRLEDVIAIASDALGETGEHFSISASYGAVLLPHEADSLDHALQLADERMYTQKHNRSSGPREQARDVLMRTMQAKQPELQEHSSGVAALAVAVARRLGMTGEEVDEIARAAELHDVGKVGIPDAILDKPGPLDDDEWQFMRQHTILGERILNAAAALRPVAQLVRSSHERWDGLGYPDGLKGEEIPRGSRIVAICDAYEAMTSDRAYRRALSHPAACRELRAMSGTQFDPEAIDAFLAEVDRLDVDDTEDHAPAEPSVQALAARVRTLLAAPSGA